ncbi:MAG TPA: hypothetical protein ENK21_07590 [Trueperaceae bacterium]|nr:hypothetical protein [Trueperaceae bacterium]
MNIKKAVIAIIFILISLSFAQSLNGVYLLKDGGVILNLEQQADGKVLGLLTGQNASFELEGQLSPDDPNTAYGYIYATDSNLLFAIVLEEPNINMITFAILENGDPDPDNSETFVFVRDASAQAANPQTANPEPNTQTNPNRLPNNNKPVNSTTTATTEQTNSGSSTAPNSSQTNPLSQTSTGATAPSSQNPLAVKDPFIGTFVGDGLKLELIKKDESFIGQIVFNGNSFPVTAQKDNGLLIGNFQVAENIFSFSAALTQDNLRFVTDGTSYNLQRQ